jgi:hypothetical protein
MPATGRRLPAYAADALAQGGGAPITNACWKPSTVIKVAFGINGRE